MVRQSEAVREVRQFSIQLGKRAKYMIYIGIAPVGEFIGITLTCLTPSPAPIGPQMVPMPQNLCGAETDRPTFLLTHTGGLADG